MSLVIDDEFVKDTGLSEDDLRVEIACRLFAAGTLFLPHATRFAGMTRSAFEAELVKRDLPLVIYDDDSLRRDFEALDVWETGGPRAGGQ